MRHRNANRTATDVFSEIYESGRWGDGEAFDSGSGSRGEAAIRYASTVRSLLQQIGARSAVDIGCGDFRVAKQFVDELDSYVGIDVVPGLIARNVDNFGRPGVEFRLLDV